MIFFIQKSWKRIKYSMIDKKHINKLKSLIEKGFEHQAKKYLQHLIRDTKTDQYFMAYSLTTAYYNKAKPQQEYLKQFISQTGSSNGHGQCSSDYSPVYWLYFLKEDKFECRVIVNTLCFKRRLIKFEVEIEQNGCSHSISEIESKKLPEKISDCFKYSIDFIRSRKDKEFEFPISIEKPCQVRIYHRINSKMRNQIMEERFDKC